MTKRKTGSTSAGVRALCALGRLVVAQFEGRCCEVPMCSGARLGGAGRTPRAQAAADANRPGLEGAGGKRRGLGGGSVWAT